MGSDTAEKQELDAQILSDADIVVTDSLDQSQERGEVYKALSAGNVCINTLVDTWTQQTCQWAQNAHCTLIKYTEYTPQLVAWVRAFYRPVHPESTLWVYCGWGGGCQGCLVSLSFFKCLFLNIFRISPGLPNVTE